MVDANRTLWLWPFRVRRSFCGDSSCFYSIVHLRGWRRSCRECFGTRAALWLLAGGSPKPPGASLWAGSGPVPSSCLLQSPVGVKPASVTWHGVGAGTSPLLVLPELMDGGWKHCCETERRKSFFSGCKAETCRNEATLERPLGTKAHSVSSKLQSHEFIQTHPFCSPLAGCRCASVAWGARGAAAWEPRVPEASPGASRLEGPTAPLPWHSLLSHLGISKARGESSTPRWTFPHEACLPELTGCAGSSFPSVSGSHVRSTCFSSRTITNTQSYISTVFNEGITP